MFENTPSPKLESYVVTLVGDPGVGKTTFFVEADALLLDFEAGYKAMECTAVSFVDPEPLEGVDWGEGWEAPEAIEAAGGWENLHPWRRFDLFVKLFCTGGPQNNGFAQHGMDVPKTLAIDTIDAAYDLCVDYVCRKQGWSSPDDGGKFGRGWTAVLKEFRSVIETLIRFANNDSIDCGIGFVSHSKVRSLRSFGAEPVDKVGMALSPSASKWLFGISDFVFYAECAVDVDGQDIRVLHTQPTARFDAKARGRRDIPFPSPLPLAYDAFAAAWAKIVEGKKPEGIAVRAIAPAFVEPQKSSVWSTQ